MPAPSFEHRNALVGILRHVHRQAALQALRGFGLELDHWNPEVIGQFDPDNAITDAHNLSLHDVQYTDARHQVTILGRPWFRLVWSDAPLRFLEQHGWPTPETTSTQHALIAIEAPIKIVNLELFDDETTPSVDDAVVFIAPDISPVAARTNDLYEAAHPYDPDDLRLIGQIAEAKGPTAVDYLSEEVCMALGVALLGAEAKVNID